MGIDRHTAIKLEAEDVMAAPSPATRPSQTIAIAFILPKTEPKQLASKKHRTKNNQNGGIPFQTRVASSSKPEKMVMCISERAKYDLAKHHSKDEEREDQLGGVYVRNAQIGADVHQAGQDRIDAHGGEGHERNELSLAEFGFQIGLQSKENGACLMRNAPL